MRKPRKHEATGDAGSNGTPPAAPVPRTRCPRAARRSSCRGRRCRWAEASAAARCRTATRRSQRRTRTCPASRLGRRWAGSRCRRRRSCCWTAGRWRTPCLGSCTQRGSGCCSCSRQGKREWGGGAVDDVQAWLRNVGSKQNALLRRCSSDAVLQYTNKSLGRQGVVFSLRVCVNMCLCMCVCMLHVCVFACLCLYVYVCAFVLSVCLSVCVYMYILVLHNHGSVKL